MQVRLSLAVAIAGAIALCAPSTTAFADDADSDSRGTGDVATMQPRQLPVIEVVSVTPLLGLTVPPDQVPFQVQQATGDELQRQQSLSLADYLNDNFSGINVNETQGNPFQAAVRYHGFNASPLLGAPEGLSVYQDGVRVNEAFGSTVNWDLIPESSIENISLISGSNPVFGLNTLGGALSIRTRDGHTDPGTRLEASGGSFDRRDAQFRTGGTHGSLDYFVTGNYFHEDGWRDLSPSTVRQGFAKVGWQGEDSAVHLAYNWANNNLVGNGVTPRSMLAVRRRSIFTAPDQTRNRLNFVNLTGSHHFDSRTLLAGNVYYRKLVTHSLNGDDNDDYGELDGEGDDGDEGFDYAEACVPITDDNIEACAPGIDHRSRLRQRTFGAGVQLSDSHDLFDRQNIAIVGAEFSTTRTAFLQSQQLASLTPARATTTAVVPFDDPAINPDETVNDLSGHNRIYGFYVTDTFSPSAQWHVTVSARYNRIAPTLDGFSVADGDARDIVLKHSFTRLNPALGVTYTPSRNLALYANYNEGTRAPTVIELGCADPDFPCGLPNDFAADPDLKEVVARTFAVGARGSIGGERLRWNLDLFHTRASNDIEFIKTNLSEGYFNNVGDTRRQGLDLGLSGRAGSLTWRAAYSLVDATYRGSFSLNAGANSSCINPPGTDDDDDCLITVTPGNRIPLIPRSIGRVAVNYDVTPQLNVGANVVVSSWQYLTGNENNANRPGGITNAGDGNPVLGTGRISGYAVVNLNAAYRVNRNVELFVKVINLFDKDYATSGFLSDSGFSADGSFRADGSKTNEDMIAPAAPRAGWVGVRIRL